MKKFGLAVPDEYGFYHIVYKTKLYPFQDDDPTELFTRVVESFKTFVENNLFGTALLEDGSWEDSPYGNFVDLMIQATTYSSDPDITSKKISAYIDSRLIDPVKHKRYIPDSDDYQDRLTLVYL